MVAATSRARAARGLRLAAATALVVLAALPARAERVAPPPVAPAAPAPVDDHAILGDDPEDGFAVESVRVLFAFFDQVGRGYQSQAGPEQGPGSEATRIYEPWGQVVLRQSARVRHEITIPVDIVTAASPDALDAVSSASYANEAGGFDVKTSIQTAPDLLVTTRVAFHAEEPMSSFTLGAGFVRSVADDNATWGLSVNFTGDFFDLTNQEGEYLRKTGRFTTNANFTFSQLLSPTTVFDGAYGVTQQNGMIRTAWNAVPIAGLPPTAEALPDVRLRHAFTGRLAQHVPWTRSTLKLWYRYYLDDYGLTAHTVEATAYQYVVRWLYARVAYRFHRQTGVDAFTTQLPGPPEFGTFRTADSDLAPFDAHEVDVALVLLGERAPGWFRGTSLSLGYTHYARDNDLTINAFTLGCGWSF